MNLDELIQKIPRNILALIVLAGAIFFFVYNNPLRDECEIQSDIFARKTAEILTGVRKNKKIQYPLLYYSQSSCKLGNSIGACSDYFDQLKTIARELRSVSTKCQIRYSAEHDELLKALSSAVYIMPLTAWGSKPPEGLADRAGWLTDDHLHTFCYLKKVFTDLAGEEELLKIRNRVYNQYPDRWADNTNFDNIIDKNSPKSDDLSVLGEKKDDEKKKVDIEKIIDENRPRALKSASNPKGSLNSQQVYERSLFSIRCDLYM